MRWAAPRSNVPVSEPPRESLTRHARLICTVCLSMWSAVCTAGQTAGPAGLSATLRNHLEDERFQIVTSLRGLPLGVRNELQTLFGTHTLDIAEPGAPFDGAGAAGHPTLPARRLVAAGCSNDHCLVLYERRGSDQPWIVALFHWTPAATRLEWGGRAQSGLATIDDVRSAVLSGTIKGPVESW